ncbi:MAG: GGDEF domain-containing protein [Parvularculaceae bacterium]|nr:GGDEF domain-containing protein [Parvularculaceae bacterium]
MTGEARDSVSVGTTTAIMQIASRVVSELERFGVPPVPECYEVWFTHIQGSMPALSNEINERLEAAAPIDTGFIKALYYKHCGIEHIQAAFDKHYEGIMKEVRGLQDVATNLTSSATDFGAEVTEIAGAVEKATPAEFGKLVGALIESAGKAAQRNAALESELAAATHKIGALHDSIKEIEQDAHTDFLTKLSNRRRFDKFLRDAHTVAMREGAPFSLIVGDVDHFKKFNDTFGHPVGDQVLKFVGSVLKNNTKGQDLCARYGGEEFAIALPNTNAQHAASLAEHIRAAIARRKLISRTTNEDLGTITMSFGVCELRPGLTPEQLFEEADAALYEAKKGGRNRVVVRETQLLRQIA